MDLSLIYREELMDHIKNPKNKGVLKNYTNKVLVTNTSCGDKIVVYANIKNDVIVDLKYKPSACAISVASASMLSDQLIGLSTQELDKINKDTVLGNFYNTLTPSRQKCALLVLEAIKKLKDQIGKNKN